LIDYTLWLYNYQLHLNGWCLSFADVEQPDSRRMPDTGDAAEAPHWIRLQTSNWAATLPTMDEILVEYHSYIYI
jgi:hypothetical protein